ncbi:hypothetical protein [Streptomyces sp. NPDC058620]|uniref:hypothetical protein n=1 Tax=Streptomyces sp. NPDC058620 TaxID=3346560 RepID=UPI00365B19AA
MAAEERGGGQAVTVHTERGAGLHARVLAALDGIRGGRVVTREPTLEDAYIAIVEEANGARPEAGSPGAQDLMGIWSSVLFGSGGAVQNQRRLGTRETLVASPAPLFLVLLPITLATAVIGTYAMGATVLWGAVLVGVPLDFAHLLLFLVAVPVRVLSLGMMGLLLAATFVLLRDANALANPLDARHDLSSSAVPSPAAPCATGRRRPCSSARSWSGRCCNCFSSSSRGGSRGWRTSARRC